MHNRARLSELTAAIRGRQQPGDEFTKFCWLLGKHAKRAGDLLSAQEDAERMFSVSAPNVQRVLMSAVAAGTTTSVGWAQELSAYKSLTADWIHNVVQLTVLGRLAYTRTPFQKKVIVQTGEFSAGWIEQAQPIPVSKAVLSTPATLQPRKVGTIVGFTDELFEEWSPAVQANFEEAIRTAVIYASDFQLLDPAVSETPARPASLTSGVAPSQSTGSSAAQVIADLSAMLGQLLVAKGADPSRVLIAMAPTTALYLSQLLTTGGAYAFPDMGATGGAIWRIPVIVTTAAAQIGSPGSNFIAAIAGDRILVADDALVLVEASTATALAMSDNPAVPSTLTSLFQTHSRALRLVRYLNYTRASTNAVAWFPCPY